jgi:hypothetical protein
MIKNLVVSGCSFTETRSGGWADQVAEKIKFEKFINLAKSGAGNFYIADSLVQCLATEKLVPDETLVLVMWTGITRKDICVSEDYFKILDKISGVIQYDQCYALSGGIAGTWQADINRSNIFKWFIHPLFDALYKATDYASFSHDTLSNMISTKSFLELHGYNYRFMSYVNYWGTGPQQVSPNLDFNIKEFIPNDPLLGLIGDKWIWADNNNMCFYEFAKQKNLLTDDNFHPSQEGHNLFAKTVILPQLQEYFE